MSSYPWIIFLMKFNSESWKRLLPLIILGSEIPLLLLVLVNMRLSKQIGIWLFKSFLQTALCNPLFFSPEALLMDKIPSHYPLLFFIFYFLMSWFLRHQITGILVLKYSLLLGYRCGLQNTPTENAQLPLKTQHDIRHTRLRGSHSVFCSASALRQIQNHSTFLYPSFLFVKIGVIIFHYSQEVQF